MKIFLTGGSGFIGQNFIKLLYQKDILFMLLQEKQNFENKILNG